MQALSIAFNRPETSAQLSSSSARPVDLDHLARQTMGQKDLEQEVLRLFLRQARESMRNIAAATADERRRVAHLLKGSARGVGAFVVAERAERLERAPEAGENLDHLAKSIVDVENFLLRLSR